MPVPARHRKIYQKFPAKKMQEPKNNLIQPPVGKNPGNPDTQRSPCNHRVVKFLENRKGTGNGGF
jgi:hypothetical protein